MIFLSTSQCFRKYAVRSFGSARTVPFTTRSTDHGFITTSVGVKRTRESTSILGNSLRHPIPRLCDPINNSFSTHRRAVEIVESHDTGEEDHHHVQDERQQNNEYKFMTGPNPGLASVICQGLKSLDQTAEDIRYKTRNDTLSRAHKKPSFRNGRAAEMDPRQLAEGQRILDVALDCLEQLALKEEQNKTRQQRGGGGSNGLVLFGEPIVLLECEVNRNVRQAKIYWTLPYGILLDNRINQGLYQEIMVKVQRQLVENGGAKLLARDVHTRLSHYYPPRIKLFPATDEMVQKAIEEFMM